ncbi:MAG: hypothetical protein RMJ56_03920 [Gemmataceae bacterium]|nr:hypothetical protein [Gemmata sp.]MDW8196737.1 hypothetical protein [Gemmataceae bacterium]
MARRDFPNGLLSVFLTLALVATTRAEDPPECPRPLIIYDNPDEIVFKFPFRHGLRVEWKYHNPAPAQAAAPPAQGIQWRHKPTVSNGLTGGFGMPRPSPFLMIPFSPMGVIRDNEVKWVDFTTDTCVPCPPCPFPPVTPNPLIGTWQRDTGHGVVTATFTQDELKITLQPAEAKEITILLTASYSLMKDGLVFGAITSADVELSDGWPSDNEMLRKITKLRGQLQSCSDWPFSFRTKATGLGMMVSGVKFPVMEGFDEEIGLLLGGVYKSSKKTPSGSARVETPASGSMATNPNDRATPRPPIPQPPAPALSNPPMVPPANPFCAAGDDAMKQIAYEAFQTLLKKSGITPAVEVTLAPACEPCPRVVTAETASASAAIKPATTTPVGKTHSRLQGTWYRQMGGYQCAMAFQDGQMTITQSFLETMEDGALVVAHLIITADYQIVREGTTILGLITGVDLTFEEPVASTAMRPLRDTLEQLAALKTQIEEKPFAMTGQVRDDTLIIGSVRMPACSLWQELEPASFIGGRYTNTGGQPVPKLKPAGEKPFQKSK